jgi:hypothetical protein
VFVVVVIIVVVFIVVIIVIAVWPPVPLGFDVIIIILAGFQATSVVGFALGLAVHKHKHITLSQSYFISTKSESYLVKSTNFEIYYQDTILRYHADAIFGPQSNETVTPIYNFKVTILNQLNTPTPSSTPNQVTSNQIYQIAKF